MGIHTYVLLYPTTGIKLGCARFGADGWRFYPYVAGRSPSRKGWPSYYTCLPKWARQHIDTGARLEPRPDAC